MNNDHPHTVLQVAIDGADTQPPRWTGTLPSTKGAPSSLPHIPGFQLESELGRGGMGVVYLARQVRLNRLVALKMILSGDHANEETKLRFLAEAEAIAKLNHPGIVQVHEFGTHDNNPYFALEYISGGSLDKKLAGNPLPPREAADLVEKLARAVQSAHDAGIIHRDLKPANILLDSPLPSAGEGSGVRGSVGFAPKITDFGLVKNIGSNMTATGEILGTPSYMAPEQADGKKCVGPGVDIYALGAILYECLTGRAPFKAATPLDTLLQVINDEPVSVRQLQAKTPMDLETICQKCLQKEPGKRYGSAAELAEDLGRYLRHEPIAARPVGKLEKVWRWCRRNRAVASLLSVVVVILGSLLGVMIWGMKYGLIDTSSDDLRNLVSELDRTDPDWRLEDIEAKRKVIPESENGAQLISGFRQIVSDITGNRSTEGNWMSQREREEDEIPQNPTTPLTDDDIRFYRAEIKKCELALAHAKKAINYPNGAIVIKHKRDSYSTLYLDPMAGSQMAGILEIDGLLQINDGNYAGAIINCLSILNISRWYLDDPSALGQFIRIGIMSSSMHFLERLGFQDEINCKELASCQEIYQEAARTPVQLLISRGERAMLHNFMNSLGTSDLKSEDMKRYLYNTKESKDIEYSQIPGSYIFRHRHILMMKYMNDWVEIARMSSEKWQPLLNVLDDQRNSILQSEPSLIDTSLNVNTPDAHKITLRIIQHMAEVRSCLAAIAVERYRQDKGKWPRNLASLVPEYLKDVPNDPYDGRPIRFRPTTDGVVVYCIGRDMEDNQGKLSRESKTPKGWDVGFQLWDVAARNKNKRSRSTP